MIVGHQFYFYSKKFLNIQNDEEFIQAKNQFFQGRIADYSKLEPLAKWHQVLALLKLEFPDLHPECLLPNPPHTGLQKFSALQKILEESRKAPVYFKDLLEGFEKLSFILCTSHSVYQLSLQKKNQLSVDILKLIKDNPEGLEVRIRLYCLVHQYREAKDWICRELEKSRLKCLLEIAKKYQIAHLKFFPSFMKIATEANVWEAHELNTEDKMAAFSLQALEFSFYRYFQDIYGAYLEGSLNLLIDYALEQINNAIPDTHQTSCMPFRLFQDTRNKVLEWGSNEFHLSLPQVEKVNLIFQKLFKKDILPQLFLPKKDTRASKCLQPLSILKTCIRSEILDRWEKEQFIFSFNDLILDSKLQEQVFLVGPEKFKAYQTFYFQLNAHHPIQVKLNQHDKYFLKFCKHQVIHCRVEDIRAKYQPSKVILQKLILNGLDEAIGSNQLEKIQQLTRQLISLNKLSWHEMYVLNESYYQNEQVMQVLLQTDPFLMIQKKIINTESLNLAKAFYPELSEVWFAQDFASKDLLHLRRLAVLNMLMTENKLTESLIEKHIFLLSMKDFLNVMRVRKDNELQALPGLNSRFALELFEKFIEQKEKFEKMPDKILRVEEIYQIFDSPQGWYYQFKLWYQYHTSVIRGLELVALSVGLYCLNWIFQFTAGVTQIVFSIVNLLMYYFSLFLEHYLPISKTFSDTLKSTLSNMPQFFYQFTKPLQNMTDKTCYDFSEFKDSWASVVKM